MTKKEQTITKDEVKKEFKLLKEKGARLKKDLEKLERRRKEAGIGLQDEGGIKGELETLQFLGRVTSIASSSLSRVSDSLHSAAVEVTKDGMAIKDLISQNPKAAKEYQRILENVKKIYSKEKKETSVTHEDTLDTLANLLDRYLENLEKELEEKKAPAVTKKPAPKPEKPAEAAPPDYKSMKWSDLQKLASNRGLKVVGAGVKKDKVIADLKAMDMGEVVAPAEEKKAPAVTKKPAPKPEKVAEKLDIHIKKLEKELEEKKPPAVTKKPAPKAKKAAKKPAKKKAPAVPKK